MFFQVYFSVSNILNKIILVKLVARKFVHDTRGISKIFVYNHLLSLVICAQGLDLLDAVLGSIIVDVKAI